MHFRVFDINLIDLLINYHFICHNLTDAKNAKDVNVTNYADEIENV